MPSPRIRSYVICTSPRSGSMLLCGLLAATNLAGKPGSHFHEPSLDRWLEVYGLSDRAFASRDEARRAVFDAARERGSGGTGVFGLRMQRGSFAHFMEQLDALHPGEAGGVERIEAEFGPTLLVHLTRPDKLARAISRVRAEQSGLWHRAADGTELERLARASEPRYDPDAIAHHMADLAALDGAWDAWFARERREPLRITYDQLAVDPRGMLSVVLAALGLDPAVAASVDPPTAKLADAMSRAWRERFATDEQDHAT